MCDIVFGCFVIVFVVALRVTFFGVCVFVFVIVFLLFAIGCSCVLDGWLIVCLSCVRCVLFCCVCVCAVVCDAVFGWFVCCCVYCLLCVCLCRVCFMCAVVFVLLCVPVLYCCCVSVCECWFPFFHFLFLFGGGC